MSTNAPIAIFCFNRPEHLRKCLTALSKCDGFAETPIVVFGDGPRRPEDTEKVEAAQAVARELLNDQASYFFSAINKGLARSIIDGVSQVVEEYGRVIVLEDDLDFAPNFITYMNEALHRYAEDANVFHVAGYAYDAPELVDSGRAGLLPFISSWGWGTWKRAWVQLDQTASGWASIRQDGALRRRFNLGDVYDFATMLERQMAGKIDSWAIRWYWTVFNKNGLCLFPPSTLVHNNGFDGSGSHGRGIFRRYGAGSAAFHVTKIDFPEPMLDTVAFDAVRKTMWHRNGGAVGRLVDIAKKVLWRLGLR